MLTNGLLVQNGLSEPKDAYYLGFGAKPPGDSYGDNSGDNLSRCMSAHVGSLLAHQLNFALNKGFSRPG
jgi:hypothetical protein